MSIHGLILEVRVTGCRKLRDTEFFTRQDPYVVIEYATTKVRTSTCTDGGRNPTFDEKFHIPLIEGLRELSVGVWNSNTFTHDDFIGNGRVYLHKVLANGYDDSSWPLQTRHNRSAGEVKLIMHVDISAMKNRMGRSVAASSTHSVPPLPMPVPAAASAPVPAPPAPAPALASAVPYTGVPPSYPPTSAYPATTPYPAYPIPSQAPYTAPEYPPPQQQPYPPPPAGYPPPAYPPQQSYEQPYPPQPYGQQPYPPPPMAQSPYPPAPYPGTYPPRPY